MQPSSVALPVIWLAGSLALGPARAETLHVELQDMSVAGSMDGMHITVDKTEIKPGKTTFEVKNSSKSLVHEMLVIKSDLSADNLPYDEKASAIAEDKIKSMGEVSELQPGKSGHLSVSLNAGSYLLACNQPGHSHAGMWTKLVVKP